MTTTAANRNLKDIGKIIDLFETPGKWCRKVWAEDKDGNEVPVTSPDAVSFCLFGAALKFSIYPNSQESLNNLITKISQSIKFLYSEIHWWSRDPSGQTIVVYFNDKIAKDSNDVLQVLRHTKEHLLEDLG